MFLPAENLAGVKRYGQITIADAQKDFRRGHLLQIVARPEMDAVEHAVADFDVLLAEVGDGFKFLRDARRQRGRSRQGRSNSNQSNV